MAGELRWTGVPEFVASLEKSIVRMSAESRSFVSEAAAAIEAGAKGHASGRPGPEVITGALRRGIVHKPITPWGVRGWQTDVGPTVIYSRRIELGFHDADSLGRSYNQPAYPYFAPAYTEVSRTLPGQWKLRCRAALGL